MIARMRELALVRLSGEKGEEEVRGDWIILVGLCLFVIIIRVFHFIRRCIVFMRLITGTTNGSRKIFLTRNNDNYKMNNFKVFSNVILELIPEARFFSIKVFESFKTESIEDRRGNPTSQPWVGIWLPRISV